MGLHFASYVSTAHFRTLSTIIFPALSIKRENRSQYKRLQSNPVWNVIERNVTCRRALCNVTLLVVAEYSNFEGENCTIQHKELLFVVWPLPKCNVTCRRSLCYVRVLIVTE